MIFPTTTKKNLHVERNPQKCYLKTKNGVLTLTFFLLDSRNSFLTSFLEMIFVSNHVENPFFSFSLSLSPFAFLVVAGRKEGVGARKREMRKQKKNCMPLCLNIASTCRYFHLICTFAFLFPFLDTFFIIQPTGIDKALLVP